MRLFLTVLEGRTPSEAEPIFATEDRHLIRLVASSINRRLDPDLAREGAPSTSERTRGVPR